MKRRELPNRIRELREMRDLTQDALAEAAGTTKMQISRLERGERRLTQGWMERLGAALGCGPAELLPGAEPAATPVAERPGEILSLGGEVSPAAGHRPIAAGALPRDVPVLGTTRGGSSGRAGDFEMNGEVVDSVRRPPGLTEQRAFALYVVGDSMAPWRQPGDLVYVSRARPPRPGDYVVVELQPPRADDPPSALLKRYVALRGDRVVLEQYNPRRELRIEQRQIRHLYRVIDWAELLGM